MSVIAGLQDFRQEGPPADIGTFQLPCSILVFQHTFAGTTYICAVRAGVRGWVLVDYGTVASTVMNAAIAALPVAGGEIYVKHSNYTIAASIVDGGRDDVTLCCERGTIFTAVAGLNTPVIYLTSVHGWRIRDLEIDGNAANQVIGNPSGIEIWGSIDCHVENVYIHDCRVFGFFPYGTGTVNVGIRDSKVTYCGWCGINLAGGVTFDELDLYAINNEVSHCSDGGITTWGLFTNISDNYVHDMDGTTGDVNSRWGLSIEGGYGNNIVNNTATGCVIGIDIANSNNNVVALNRVTSGTGTAYNSACMILNTAQYNIVADNSFSHAMGYGLYLMVTSDYNTIEGNHIFDNGEANAGGQVGLGINASSYNIIHGNRSYEDRAGAARRQQYGLLIYGVDCVGNIVADNYNHNNSVDQYLDSGLATILVDNENYNPRGNIATPWPAAAGNLADVAAAQDNPTSAVLYTVVNSPKLILLTNCGGISQVQIDGVTLVNITTAAPQFYKLYPGQTIRVTWTATIPNGQVFAE